MLKQTYEIDENGFIIEIYVAESDEHGNMSEVKVPVLDFDGKPAKDEEGNIIERVVENLIPIDPPNGLYRAKWTGSEWIEDMTQAEIDELNKPQPHVPSDTEVLGQQMTEREIEAMTQGQQITDIDLRLMIYEMEV